MRIVMVVVSLLAVAALMCGCPTKNVGSEEQPAAQGEVGA